MSENCPMLEKCRKKCGMECEGRNFAKCRFYKLLLKEAKENKKILQEKSWTKPQILEERRENLRKMRALKWQEQKEFERKLYEEVKQHD